MGRCHKCHSDDPDTYHAEAWLYGPITTEEFTDWKKPLLNPDLETNVPDGDFIAQNHAEIYYVSLDTQGEIGWESGTFRKAGRPDAHVIEILTENTPTAYRGYLREKGVSYILAGKETLDAKTASEKLYRFFGIDTMLSCGGGTVNWTFLQQGCVDELSLILASAADGNPDTVTVFEKSEFLSDSVPVEFQLKNVEKLEKNSIRLVYTVKYEE